jgi:hypothetical protein
VILDAEDGRSFTLALPAGWSVEAEPGARVVVTGDVVDAVVHDVAGDTPGGTTLRVRRISTA